ncbi:MAG: tetratricopeptide repeat protein [Phycisphaerales bacterium]|nr:tetratricopeptide repeat protein [Planctomycetota bacterium]MCH8509467.1 tetratricopeptide repeat protein [Phycisphaerales bacterium]
MAGKVNTKFVVLLSAGLVCVFGLLAWAFVALAFKSGGDFERMGDQAMQEGDFYRAQRMYGRAVGKDTTNPLWLGKWIDAMESWVPETQTAYQNAFFREYIGAIAQVADAKRTDVDAHDRLLSLLHDRLMLGYSRGEADQVVERTTRAASQFDRADESDSGWKRLLRYRGMAMEMVLQSGSVVTDDQVRLIGEDLRAALEADPADGESMAALMRWTVMNEIRQSRVDQDEAERRGREEAMRMGRAFLERNPRDPDITLMMLAYRADRILEGTGRDDPVERIRRITEDLAELRPELDRITELFLDLGPERIKAHHINRFQRLDRFLDGASQMARTRAVLDAFLAVRPDDALLLNFSADSARVAGDLETASERLAEIGRLPMMPLSLEGLHRFHLQRGALLQRSGVILDMYDQTILRGDADQALLDRAKALREEYRQQVSEDDRGLMVLDGRIAMAEGDHSEALRILRRHNEMAQNRHAEGLWLEARAALQLERTGTARTALQRLLEVDPNHLRAMLVLADTETRLQNNRRAAELYQRVLQMNPENQVARDGLRRIEMIDNPDLIEDPVAALLTRAGRLRIGWDGSAPDLGEAARLIETNLERVDYDPRAVIELVEIRVTLGDMAGAQSLIERASRRHPEEPVIRNLKEALASGDPIRARIRMVELSGRDEAQQAVTIASIALSGGDTARLDEALATLDRLGSDNPMYVDIAFIRALDKGDMDRARALAQKAESMNLDRVRGLTYRSRLASASGNSGEAISALEQAAALGTGDSSVHRLLGRELRDAGRYDESLRAYERALQIRPDDVTATLEFVQTLAMANRLDRALEEARRRQRFAMVSPQFVDLWLRLEAAAGGEEGIALAVRNREQTLEINPADRQNRAALAELYIEQRRWSDAKVLIDQLRSEGDSLGLVNLAARWNAEQGRVGTRDGLVLAQDVYQSYIDTLEDRAEAMNAYIAMAQFVLSRGRPDLAMRAAENAVSRESADTMLGTKLKSEILLSLNQHAMAAESLQSVVDAGADTPDQIYRQRLIESLIRTGQIDKAESEVGRLPSEQRNSLTGMMQRADLAAAKGDRAAERRLLDEAVAAFPQDPTVFVRRAQSMSRDPRMQADAMADLEAALRLRPGDWRALRLRAAMHFSNDRRADALRDLHSALRSNPAMDDMLFSLANELINDGRPGEALDVAREVLERRPNDAPLMFEIARLFESRGHWGRASEMYGRAWQTRRGPEDGLKYIDALLRRSPPDATTANEVLTSLQQMIGAASQDNPGILAVQAMVLRARGREDFALQQMTRAFELSLEEDGRIISWASNAQRFYLNMTPDSELNYYRTLRARYTDARVRNWLDMIIAQRRIVHGQGPTEAISDLKRLGTDPNTHGLVRRMSLRTIGNHQYETGNYEAAVEAWRLGLETEPDDWELNNNIAYVLSTRMNRHEEALGLAEKALEGSGGRAEIYDTMAAVYIGLRRFDEAEQMLRMAEQRSRTYQSRVAASITRARLELARNDRPAARRHLDDARAMLRGIAGQDSKTQDTIRTLEAQIGSEG